MNIKNVCLLGVFVLMTACASASGPQVCFDQSCVTVEVMRTDEELRRGMQGRDGLQSDHGMLFVFENDQRHRFWMKDTRIPLDMIWIDHDQRVVGIQHSAEPCKKDPCPTYAPQERARYVLEVRGGVAKVKNIQPGDRVRFKLDKTVE